MNTFVSFDCFRLRFFRLIGGKIQLLQTSDLAVLSNQPQEDYCSINMYRQT